jgi:hypothetical protein
MEQLDAVNVRLSTLESLINPGSLTMAFLRSFADLRAAVGELQAERGLGPIAIRGPTSGLKRVFLV